MEYNKNVQKVAYSFFSLIIAVLIGVIIYQQHLIKSISKINVPGALEHSDEKNIIDTSAGQHRDADDKKSSSGISKKEINDLEYQLNAAEEELSMAQDKLSVEIDKQSDFNELQKMMSQTPEEKSRMRMDMKNQVDRLYGPMFTKLGISGENLEAFKNVIVDQKMAQQEFFEKMEGKNLTQEGQSEVLQGVISINNEYQNKMRELFGEEATSQYKANQLREGEMYHVSQFSEYLSGTDRLTDKQREKLVDSMYEAKNKLESVMIEEGASMNSTDLNKEERVKEINIRIMEKYLNSAENILSSSQLDRFDFYINQYIQRIQ